MTKNKQYILIISSVIVLLITIAYLQYNWINQINMMQVEQLKKIAENACLQASIEFTGELNVYSRKINEETHFNNANDVIKFIDTNRSEFEKLRKNMKVISIKFVDVEFKPNYLNNDSLKNNNVQFYKEFKPKNKIQKNSDIDDFSKRRFRKKYLKLENDFTLMTIPVFIYGKGYKKIEIQFDNNSIFKVISKLVNKRFTDDITPKIWIKIKNNKDEVLFLSKGNINENLLEVQKDNFDKKYSFVSSIPIGFIQPYNPDEIENLKANFVSTLKRNIRSTSDFEENKYNENFLEVHENDDPSNILDYSSNKKNYSELNPELLEICLEKNDFDLAVQDFKYRNIALSLIVLTLLLITFVLLVRISSNAEKLAAEKMQFVAAISHELRTPISVIKSSAENISSGIISEPTKLKIYGDLIKNESKKLWSTLETILNYAGVENSNHLTQKTNINFEELIDSIISNYQNNINSNKILIDKQIEKNIPNILLDLTSLQITFKNIIENAIKFSKVNGIIEISVKEYSNFIIVNVKDNGIGISKIDQKSIFQPFFRSKNAIESRINGNGIGLSLVKKIVDKNSWFIKIDSQENLGTNVEIKIPSKGA